MTLARPNRLLVILVFAFFSIGRAGGRRGQNARSPAAQAAYAILKNAKSKSDVLHVLREAGYTKSKHWGLKTFLHTKKTKSRVVGHACHNASIRTQTSFHDKDAAYALGYAAEHMTPNDSQTQKAPTYLEQDETLKGRQTEGTKLSIGTRGNKNDRVADLICECQPYNCHCQKQCFCRMTEDPFKGLHYPPEANCPVCPVCSDMKTKGPDSDDNALPKSPPKQDYKCSCSFEGIGGAGLSNGGYMECDCKVADCTCEKKCACRKRSAVPLPVSTPVQKQRVEEPASSHSEPREESSKQEEEKSYGTGVCCKFRDPKGRGPGEHFVWLTDPQEVKSCHMGSYGDQSYAMAPGLLNEAGEGMNTPSGCRRISGSQRSLPGNPNMISHNEAGPNKRLVGALCCIYEDSHESTGAKYAWLTSTADMMLCAAGHYKGRSIPAQGTNPVGEPYARKDACRDVLATAPVISPTVNEKITTHGRRL